MTDRKVTLEDVARQFIRDNNCGLDDQLLLSCFVEKAKRVLAEQPETEVVDREKGLRRMSPRSHGRSGGPHPARKRVGEAVTERKVSLRAIAKDYLRAKSASLEEQLEVSIYIAKLERELAAKDEQQKALAEFREKGLRRVK